VDGISCDLCGKGLLIDEQVRYTVRIEIKAAYDPMEIVREDLDRDLRAEMEGLIEKMKGMSKEDAANQVYKVFHFDLCPPCQKRYLKRPLPRPQENGDAGGRGDP
jgi:hypothetical protein